MPMLALIGIAAVVAVSPFGGAGGAPAPSSCPWPGADDDAARALVARDDGERLRTLLALARVDSSSATALLVSALRDRDPGVRLTAGRLLARRGAREATVAATAWLSAPAANERLLGLLVLRDAAEQPDDARRAVERALRDGDVTARLQGLDLLQAHPTPGSLGAVVALLDDEIGEVRARALRALAAMADARASLAVTRRLADSDRGVRIEAATTLGALGDRRVVPALLRQLDERSADPRTWVVDALGRLGDGTALPALAQLAARSPRDELARHATLALGALGTPAAVEALLVLAREPPGPDDVRLALERAGASAVPRLGREVSAGSPTSARLAATALGRLGDRRATAALVAAVERGGGARLASLEALARLGDPAAVPALVHVAIAAEVPELRVLALDALEATGDAGALVALPHSLEDADPGVRARAARLTGALGGSAQAAGLVARLVDGDALVRSEAARALAHLPSLPDGLARPLADALPRAPLSAPTEDALGDVLERVARPEDGAALGRAYLSTRAADARAVLARGLAAAFSEAPLEDQAVVAALQADVGAGGAPALSAAEALAGARLSGAAAVALRDAFARAEDPVRAGLAPALARIPAGATTLALALADPRTAPSVRAAAAWALAAAPEARAALQQALTSPEPAVAANARAALSVQSVPKDRARRGRRWSAVELRSAADEPLAGRWVTVSAAGGAPVWVMTDSRGRARVVALGDGPLALSLPTGSPTGNPTGNPTE